MSKETIPLSPLAETIAVGSFYEHYKGPHYKVIGIARHSETLEEVVVYLDPLGMTWVRPLAIFVEDVTIDGCSKPRFQLVKN